MSDSIRIGSAFAGGNIKVRSIENGRVTLEQEVRDSSEWWFYWQFKAEAGRGQTWVFDMANGDVVGPFGPAVSPDGLHWSWLPSGQVLSRTSFQYDFAAGEEVYFSVAIPYQLHHFETFCSRIAADPHVERDVLTVSEEWRAIPLLRIGKPDAALHLVMTCRHHACESTANYMLEGLIERVLTRPDGRLRSHGRIHFIPFMDIDGVEKGDQGKHRLPHDHNRDYIESPIYLSTKALTAYTARYKPAVAIDFHCPFQWGGENDHPFIVKHDEPVKSETEKFAARLRETTAARTDAHAIRYSGEHDLEMGIAWNRPEGRTCASMFERSGSKLIFSFEVPYYGVGQPYTADRLRDFGRDFADALEQYLADEAE